MVNRSVLIFLFITLLCSLAASAATLTGSVFTEDLEPATAVIVGLDQERQVAQNGDYSFIVEPGVYQLLIHTLDTHGNVATTQEEHITITQNKEYVFDIILLDSFAEEADLVDDAATIFPVDGLWAWSIPLWAIILISILALVAVISIVIARKSPSALVSSNRWTDTLQPTVLRFIRQAGGRVTQKEIRQQFPASEAKISLLLTELEQQGVVRKVKKGRGNIIVLTSS